jgi:7,8-dihydropterin-6-yl-methyl-4-(beta-D-ribofuranosyl)aminobenzene 5'-phosphate synthase
MRKGDREIRETIMQLKELGLHYVAPGHCTGDRARELFKQEFKDEYVACAAGVVISVSELSGDGMTRGREGHPKGK